MRPETKYTASEYANLFQKGDERALAYFYKELHAVLTFYAHQWVNDLEIAREVASDAFVKIWKHHHKLDSYWGIQGYLYKTVRRDAYRAMSRNNIYKKARKSSQINTVTNETAIDNLIRAETCRLVHSALNELPKGSRTILMLHYIEGKKLTTIAEELKLSLSTIKVQKMNGLKALRKHFLRPAIVIFLFFSNIFFPAG